MRSLKFKNGVVCALFRDFHTVPRRLDFECATRILLNLKNLCIDRGTMVGPLHYFGCVDPLGMYTIGNDGFTESRGAVQEDQPVGPEPDYVSVDYEWRSGVLKGKSEWSLFVSPGVLVLDVKRLRVPVNGPGRDYSSYRVRLVRNDRPFTFDSTYRQKKLRVISYHFSHDHYRSCIENGDGLFLETHRFVQSMTPMNGLCGGFIMVARLRNGRMDVAGVRIPYGYTLLVDSYAIHGDSTFTGTYMMAMTGDHAEMSGADTVFLRTATGENVDADFPESAVRLEPPIIYEKDAVFNPFF